MTKTETERLTANVRKNAIVILKEQGSTKNDLARRVGIPESTVIGWFNRRVLSLTTVVRIAETLNVRPESLLLSPEVRKVLREVVRGGKLSDYRVLEELCS